MGCVCPAADGVQSIQCGSVWTGEIAVRATAGMTFFQLESKFTAKDLQERLVEQGGVPLGHRLVQRAEAGHLDGAEIRDYLI